MRRPSETWYFPIWLGIFLSINGTCAALGFQVQVRLTGDWWIAWLVVVVAAVIGSIHIADLIASVLTRRRNPR